MKNRPYNLRLKGVSRNLRRTMTDAERVLWSRLRRKQILGIQFHSQKPIGPYIVDFHAPAVDLVVEVDGAHHLENEQMLSDRDREGFLRRQGLIVLRFDNRQVLVETESVMSEIYALCERRLQSSMRGESPLSPL